MSSELIVKVQKVNRILPHGNSDNLEIVEIGAEGGWQSVVKKNVFAEGQLVVYIPPDSLLPKALHEALDISKYCGELPASSIEAQEGYRRVRACRLRGTKSFGTLMTLRDLMEFIWNNPRKTDSSGKELEYFSPEALEFCGGTFTCPYGEGTDVAELLGIKKWIPKEKVLSGEAAQACSWFHHYTSIQNIKNNPGLFKQGEYVVMTEKIHGTNCRVGLAAEIGKSEDEPLSVAGAPTLTWMAGSHTVQRKEFDSEGRKSKYWEPLDNHQLRAMITELANANPSCFSVVVFGEIFGAGIQDMNYGLVGKTAFRVFDIAINSNYMNQDDVIAICLAYGIEMVPELYRGPFSQEKVEELTDGPTMLSTPDKITCKYKGREGLVVKTLIERFEPELNGRMILKSVSADYLDRKGAVDNA